MSRTPSELDAAWDVANLPPDLVVHGHSAGSSGDKSRKLAGLDLIPATATQAEAEAGTSTSVRRWTPERVKQAIAALAGSKSYLLPYAGATARSFDDHVRERWISVKDFGAVGDGVADDTAAIKATLAAAWGTKYSFTDLYGATRTRLKYPTIYFPAGRYKISDTAFFLPTWTGHVAGMVFQGAGQANTVLEFQPTAGTRRLMDGYNGFMSCKWSDMTFMSNDAQNTFFYNYTNPPGGASQDFAFWQCSWAGRWGKAFHLEGGDNNSEYSWTRCSVGGLMECFLYVPASNSSDQFLNYWFHNFKFWPTDATDVNRCIDMAMGGTIRIKDSDFSGLESCELFALRGASHARGVCHFVADSVRYELKSNNCKVLYCEWPQGVVAFRHNDFSSQASVILPTTVVFEMKHINAPGPQYLFDACEILGLTRITHASEDYRRLSAYTYRNCDFLTAKSIEDHFDIQAGTNPGGRPAIRLEGCRGSHSVDNLLAADAWAASTAYTVGQKVRTTAGDVYECAVAGTSGTAAPKRKINGVVDGTVTWNWLDANANRWAYDQTLNGLAKAGAQGKRHIAYAANSAGASPTSGGVQVIVPKNALIVGIGVVAPAGGETVNGAIEIRVSDGYDTELLVVAAADANDGFSGYLTTPIFPGADLDKRSIYFVNSTSAAAAAMCFVEYLS